LNASLNLSSSPHVVLICLTSSGAEELLASDELAGARFCQKREWLMCPPALNLMPCCIETCEVMSEVETASACVLSRLFKFVMYVWWCLLWCSSMICAEMCGSNAYGECEYDVCGV
jgi:hypothetical protein